MFRLLFVVVVKIFYYIKISDTSVNIMATIRMIYIFTENQKTDFTETTPT